jgi:hypothetical protein
MKSRYALHIYYSVLSTTLKTNSKPLFDFIKISKKYLKRFIHRYNTQQNYLLIELMMNALEIFFVEKIFFFFFQI